MITTAIVETKSYSTTFGIAIVMQLLTFLTLRLKDVVVATYSGFAMAIGVWLIMFFFEVCIFRRDRIRVP